jgi:flagellar M-ring protein FliF
LLALEGPKVEKQLADARAMALDNPAAVAAILRGWVNGDDA